MKKITDVYVGQRTALGDDRAEKTRIYIGWDDYCGVVGREAVTDLTDDIYGYVLIHHPRVLMGNWLENLDDFCRIAIRHLISDCGYYWDADGVCHPPKSHVAANVGTEGEKK